MKEAIGLTRQRGGKNRKGYFFNYEISFLDEDIKFSPDKFLKRKIMNEWVV